MSKPKTTIRVGNGPEVDLDDKKAAYREIGKLHGISEHITDKVAAAEGHNSRRKVGGNPVDQLRSIVERIEKLEEEKAGIASDIKDIYAEAKGNGYDVKTLRTIISLRKKDAAEREQAEYLLDTYKRALGMQPDLFEEEKA